MNKMPPIEKIYEAYSAIADGRVDLHSEENKATVASSDRGKEYTVSWEGDVYTSNDNASYWQGYAGYPILAVLMLQGRLPLDRDIAWLFADVNWTELNQAYKRDYAKAVAAILLERQHDAGTIKAAAQAVYDVLKSLDLVIKRGSLRPPKSAK